MIKDGDRFNNPQSSIFNQQFLVPGLHKNVGYICQFQACMNLHLQKARVLERAMGFEPTTFSLARRRTTAVLRPHHSSVISPSSAERQNRTDDTAIFSRMLYQLSYLGDILLLSVRDFTRC
jgi:hypothetical protein